MRIRSIKPEFWTSESIGRLSREARLLFIGFWSLADDSGRGRGALPYLSGSLFPFDPDAPKRLQGWISELEAEDMVRLYKAADGNTYFEIPKWLKHQKIEKPSAPRFPAFCDGSVRLRGGVGEGSPLDQGSGIREQGTGIRDQGSGNREGVPPPEPPSPPPVDDAVSILDHLNREAKREFAKTEENLKLIRCRLDEVGGDVAGTKVMVSRMVQKWGPDEKMAEFLRPATLFGKQKFRGYYDDRNQPVNHRVHNTIGSFDRGTPASAGPALPANTQRRLELLASPELVGLGPAEFRAKMAELEANRSPEPAVG